MARDRLCDVTGPVIRGAAASGVLRLRRRPWQRSAHQCPIERDRSLWYIVVVEQQHVLSHHGGTFEALPPCAGSSGATGVIVVDGLSASGSRPRLHHCRRWLLPPAAPPLAPWAAPSRSTPAPSRTHPASAVAGCYRRSVCISLPPLAAGRRKLEGWLPAACEAKAQQRLRRAAGQPTLPRAPVAPEKGRCGKCRNPFGRFENSFLQNLHRTPVDFAMASRYAEFLLLGGQAFTVAAPRSYLRSTLTLMIESMIESLK
jgi:hypothetical protein